jgi:hypothetical protein
MSQLKKSSSSSLLMKALLQKSLTEAYGNHNLHLNAIVVCGGCGGVTSVEIH